MRFDIDSNPAEARRACTAITRAALLPDHSTLIVAAVYAAVATAAAFFTPTTQLATTVIGIFAIMAAITLLQLNLRKRARHAQARDPHANETHHIELSADGVRTWCAHVDARYPWTDFSRVADTPEFILFVRPSGAGVAIPKRLIDSAAANEVFERTQAWARDIDVVRVKR